ncbi:transmembrane protein 131 [Engraulis encrasicolus]|uniref:transmembrane protein 131 n=1 Tax=Engraulis encrasicolus TaxID=184585 RepID=UPI002FD6723B
MASKGSAQSFEHLKRTKLSFMTVLRIIFIACIHVTQSSKQAFIQSDTILEVLHFGDGGLLQTEADIDLSSSYHQKSASPQRGNSRPIRFEPPMLDFQEQPVGMPKMEKVFLHNPSSEEISLISISATTAHFHASFFQNRIIPPGGNTSFDVVFLARVVGNVENTLFINTSHHGMFTYQVFGVGIPNPYRLRPFIGARVPVNSSFSPLINIHNPHSEPLQVVEMYSSGGDLHLELPTGQQGGTKKLWEIPPFETKGVMRASFSSRDADNHTAFIRIKTNNSHDDEFFILPVEVEVTSAPGIYSSTEMLDFGTLRSQDRPKQLNLHLLNSGNKDVTITSIRATPSNEAITVEFKQITLKAGESRYTKVATISFDASKARRPFQFTGRVTVKTKEKSYSKLEIPYQAEVLEGYLGFDHTATLFHIRDSPVDPVDRPIYLTNTFTFAIRIHNVSLPAEAKTMFSTHNFSTPVLVPPQQSRYIFSLLFRPVRSSVHIDSNILLITNASKFHLPVRAYTGFLEPLVLPPSLKDHVLDFGVMSATDTSSLVLVVINSNPIELEVKSWLVTGESMSMELLQTERGNRSMALSRLAELHSASATHHRAVILASGYYAAFRVTLVAKALEGVFDGAVHITTDYEILTIPVKAVVAVGTLTSSPSHIVLPPSFPGKVVHQGFSILSSFSQRVRLLHPLRPLGTDARFYAKRMRSNKEELEPRRKSKVANIYFDASLQCGDQCYVGVPFIFKSEPRPHGVAMQEDIWDTDVDLHQKLLKRWRELEERSGIEVEAIFEVNTDLQKHVQTKVSAQLMWPKLVSSPRNIHFPLTNVNSSAEEVVLLENPADVPVYVQVLPLALYPNPYMFTGLITDRLSLVNGSTIDISTDTLEFQVNKNHSSVTKPGAGFLEGSTRPFVSNLLLMPGESKSLTVTFTPNRSHSISSLLVVRNNLTVVDVVLVHGQGTRESVKLGGKSPGPGSFLRFRMTEALLKDCEIKAKEPNFTLQKTFRLENTGLLPLHVRSMAISGQPCQGYGFKVLGCQELALKPNTSKDLVILFTPDFTSSRVVRELRLVTAGGSEFSFMLNASLPYHMLAVCTDVLPRPNWELELYIVVSLMMSFMFLVVIGTAYLEAQGIWEPFKKRLVAECSSALDAGRVFDLREIVRIDANLNDYSDVNQNSTRGMYGSDGRGGRAGGRQAGTPQANGRASAELSDARLRPGSQRSTTMQSSSSSSSSSTSSAKDSSLSQLSNRKARSSSKQGQPSAPSLAEVPSTATTQGSRGLSAEDQSYNQKLLSAMDGDLDRPRSPSTDQGSQQSSQNKVLETKGKVRTKTKAQKKKEEKDRKTKGKSGVEEPRETSGDNDDCSSTTTETSNPDTETNIKEEPVKKKGRMKITQDKEKEEVPSSPTKAQIRKQTAVKKETPADKSSSLELPYVTPLENKQRKAFTPKALMTSALNIIPKPRPLQRPRLAGVRPEDGRPSPLGRFFSNGSLSELGPSSGSEGSEKESPPPEWDIPFHRAINQPDSLQQYSLQTMNADPFLKSGVPRTCSPPLPPSPCLYPRGTYSSVVNTNSDANLKKAPGNKLTKSNSLPGKNGNPTFAAVAAGYDKSPGGSGAGRPDGLGKFPLPHIPSGPTDSESSGLWSRFNPANSFSAFGPNNPLSGVFKEIASPKTTEPQPQSWSDYTPVTTSSIWQTDTGSSWPTTTSTFATAAPPTTSILGGSSSPWASTAPSAPFSSSIWSTSGDPALHSFGTATSSALTNLVSHAAPPAPVSPVSSDLGGRQYSPWSLWPTSLGGRTWNPSTSTSEPWPSHPDNSNNANNNN